MAKSLKCPEDSLGVNNGLKWCGEQIGSYPDRQSEMVEVLHPGQENVHFPKGFHQSRFCVHLQRIKS